MNRHRTNFTPNASRIRDFGLPQTPAYELRRSRGSGFTLIEVLAAMVLMAIVLPVTMQALSMSLAAASSARHLTEASGLGQAKLNELVTTGEWSSLSSGDFGAEHPGYRWETSSIARDFGLTEISFRITWTERSQDRQLALSTLIEPDTTAGVTP